LSYEATAIPHITSDFHSLNDIGWYGSSYLITQMALLPTCGRLYAFYNIKWVYSISLAVFELGSIIAAVAPYHRASSIWSRCCGPDERNNK
jgi:MFS family permease